MFCCKFSLLQLCQIFLRSVNNTQNNRKNKKGARFFETQCTTREITQKSRYYYVPK